MDFDQVITPQWLKLHALSLLWEHALEIGLTEQIKLVIVFEKQGSIGGTTSYYSRTLCILYQWLEYLWDHGN